MAQQRIGRIQWGALTFGPGSRYHVTAIEGLDDMPDIRADDMERPGQHGDYTGPDYTGPRVIQLGLGLRADSPDELRDLTLALRAATQPQRSPAPMLLLDQGTVVYGKVRRRSIPYDAEHLWRTGSAALELYCADPYLYGLEERTASTTAYSPAAGRTYPLAYSGTTVTNLVLNPSMEVDTANTDPYDPGAVGVTRVRTSGSGQPGAWRQVVNPNTGVTATSGIRYALGATVAAEQTVTISAWLRTPYVADIQLRLRNSTTGAEQVAVVAQTSVSSTWTPYAAALTTGPGETYDQAVVSITGTGGAWAIDGVMCETGPVPHAYVDGDQPGCVWNGTAHASTSTRPSPVVGANRAYGSAGQSGRIVAVNGGDSAAYPVLRLDGPIANPSVEQVNTGGGITVDATLNEGEFLTIDTRTRAVLYMGSSPRRSWVRAGAAWPLLQPGRNELVYRGTALPGPPGQQSLLTVTWRDTSL
ncbi:MAG: hypothetical protein HOV70_10660 [Streptomyces sp.]|nr:hypothetical protein [Streptomyces sp.]